jgi:hypothetical protein
MSLFTQVKMTQPKYSTFDLSHQKKLSLAMGKLVPTFVAETVPGDNFNIRTSQLLRMAPMLAPIMHQVTVYQHFFFVPNRLIYKNWEPFITGGEDGYDNSVPPTINLGTVAEASVADYMGLPTVGAGVVSALPFAAYGTVYNEYYRDENLIAPGDFLLDDGPQSVGTSVYKIAISPPKNRAWQHDYFTSALPWTQKGPEATIPLGTEAPIKAAPGTGGNFYNAIPAHYLNANFAINDNVQTDASGRLADATGTAGNRLWLDLSASHIADLSSATAATINDLRSAFRLQEWLEKNARGGSRYTESILAHFGVRSSDARLQRPEFLGGGSVPIQVSEVLQTAPGGTGQTPLAEMSGHGISVGQNATISYRCEEHGFIIGILSVMPKTAYQQGVHKMFLRSDRFDYFWPEFAHLGEQAIENREVYATHSDPDGAFGYIPRYSEYKYMNDTVHGALRTSLNFWHLGRIFSSEPSLNSEFIECDSVAENLTRVFAVPDDEQMYAIINNQVLAKRPMPYYGTPTF